MLEKKIFVLQGNLIFFYNILNYRTKRIFTFGYILKRRLKYIKRELLKPDMILVPIVTILNKAISEDKIAYSRLSVFEQIAPSH